MWNAMDVGLDEIRGEAQGLGFDLCGVAPAAEFPGVPGWARSVLVLGMAALDPAWDLEMYVEEGGTRRWSKWAYERLAAGAARLALWLVEAGRRAGGLTYEDSLAVIDLKAAAIRAGLGVRGLNTLVVTRRYGPRVRWGAVWTDLPLPAGRPVMDYYCVSCTACLAACPTAALGPRGLDRARCIGEFAPDAAMVELQKELLRFPTPHTRLQCSACVTSCPVGKRLPARFWGLDPR
ncbi:MAG: epoxyqueuosine reductase [Anaerolineaceae bacterium]|nr:epoxyqueuosine reductase [Anaerolineaceae bacterium]